MRRLIAILLFLLVGCAPWTQVGGLYRSESHNFSVDLPQGWMQWNKGDDLLITRDGALLQNIQILRLNIDKPLKYTKKKFSKGMLPPEIAETILDDLATSQSILNLNLLENSPLKIGGFDGFKIVYTYKTKDNLKMESIYCGFMLGDWLYGINYNAAQRYYFDKDVQTFQRVLESFKVIKAA
jgi:hypothetical protein